MGSAASNPNALGSVVPPFGSGAPPPGAVLSVFGRIGNVVAVAGDYSATQITNDSGVPGAMVADALDALAALIIALDSSDIANVSGVAGATVTAALNTLAATIAALDSSDIANVSGVVGATVTAALNTLNAAFAALDSSDIANVSGVVGATVTNALDTLNAAIAALVAQIAALDSSDIANVSGVVGATVTAALDTLNAAIAAINAAIAALDSSDIANVSGVAGATVTAALNTLAASIAALDSSDIANVSGVAGATVTAALDALAALIAGLDSSDIANASGVTGATVTAALQALDPNANRLIWSPDYSMIRLTGLPMASGVAYWAYVGYWPRAGVANFVRFRVQTAGAGAQTAEVAVATTPLPPNGGGQTLTILAANGTLDSLTAVGTGNKANTVSMATAIPAGSHVWVGLRTAMAITQPTVWAVAADNAAGRILSTAASGALTGGGPFVGAAFASSFAPQAPLMELMTF